MPVYAFRCDSCNHEFEEFHTISEPHPQNCPSCGKAALYQDFSKSRITGLVYGNPTTVGQLAETNTKKLGKEAFELMMKKDKKDKKIKDHGDVPLPWYRSGEVEGFPKLEKPLDVTKIKNIDNYIQHGVTNE